MKKKKKSRCLVLMARREAFKIPRMTYETFQGDRRQPEENHLTGGENRGSAGEGNTAGRSGGPRVLGATPKCFLLNPLARGEYIQRHSVQSPSLHRPGPTFSVILPPPVLPLTKCCCDPLRPPKNPKYVQSGSCDLPGPFLSLFF